MASKHRRVPPFDDKHTAADPNPSFARTDPTAAESTYTRTNQYSQQLELIRKETAHLNTVKAEAKLHHEQAKMIRHSIKEKDDQLNAVKAQLQEKNDELVFVKEELSDVKGELSDVKGELSDVKGDLEEKENQVADLEDKLLETSDLLGEVKEELKERSNQLKAAELQVKVVKDLRLHPFYREKTKIPVLQDKYNKLTGISKDLIKSLARQDDKLKAQDAQIQTLTSANTSLEDQLATCRDRLKDVTSVNTTLGQQVHALTTNNTSLKEQIGTLTAANVTSQSNSATNNATRAIAFLKDQIKNLREINTASKAQVGTLTTSNVSLRTQTAGLIATNESLRDRLAIKTDEATRLQQENESLQTQSQLHALPATFLPANILSTLATLRTSGTKDEQRAFRSLIRAHALEKLDLENIKEMWEGIWNSIVSGDVVPALAGMRGAVNELREVVGTWDREQVQEEQRQE